MFRVNDRVVLNYGVADIPAGTVGRITEVCAAFYPYRFKAMGYPSLQVAKPEIRPLGMVEADRLKAFSKAGKALSYMTEEDRLRAFVEAGRALGQDEYQIFFTNASYHHFLTEKWCKVGIVQADSCYGAAIEHGRHSEYGSNCLLRVVGKDGEAIFLIIRASKWQKKSDFVGPMRNRYLLARIV